LTQVSTDSMGVILKFLFAVTRHLDGVLQFVRDAAGTSVQAARTSHQSLGQEAREY
jgi:hypothetical protein